MDLDEYQVETRRTRTEGNSPKWDLEHFVLGLNEETGELAGIVKKHVFFGTSNQDKLVKEAGDALWYFSSLLDSLGVTLSHVSQEDARDTTKYAQRILRCVGVTSEIGEDGLPMSVVNKAHCLGICGQMCGAFARLYMQHMYGWKGRIYWMLVIRSAGTYLHLLRAMLADYKVSLEEVMDGNIQKLRTRYPDGWTREDSEVRRDERT